jgi:hypothetical protein
MFVYLYERRGLKSYFRDLHCMERQYYIFDRLAAKYLPKLFKHLQERELFSSIFLTEYFITLYCSILPFSIVARIFDIFIYENEKIIFRAALAICKLLEKPLME